MMEVKIFETRSLAGQRFSQRLFGQLPPEKGLIEFNSLLAEKEIRELRESDIEGIEQKYGLRLVDEFSLNLEEFYAVY